MARYTPGTPVRVVENGEAVVLTSAMVVAEVTAAAGGPTALAGIPAGGTPDEILRKASSADGDVRWVPGSGPGMLGVSTDTASGGLPRAAGYETVLWLAPSQPLNGVAGDVWIK